jgi:hypothetical protein
LSAPLERLLSALEAHGCRPKRNGPNAYARCPAHEDKRASLSVSVGEDGRALVKCHAGCKTADVLAALGLEAKNLFPESEKKKKGERRGREVARYSYPDENGAELYHVRRFEPKAFLPFLPGSEKSSLPPDVRRVLFRLPETLAAVKAGRPIFLTEGEKDALALAALGLDATSAQGGAGARWLAGYSESLRGGFVVIIADADEAGRQYAEKVAAGLHGIAASVRVTRVLVGKDAADYIRDGAATREDFERLAAEAPEWSPVVKVKPERLLDDVVRFIRRFVVLNEEQAVASALWVVHTHATAAFQVTPYLAITSPTKRCGKSRLMEVLALLAWRPWRVVMPSEAVTFRKIAQGVTVFLDELDALFTAKPSPAQEGLRAILNAGFARGQTVPRCTEHGNSIEEFDVFGPKCLAGINDPPATIKDRSFVIELRRARRSDARERFRLRDAEREADLLRRQIEAFASAPGRLAALRSARPELPEALNDRAQDSGEPLLAIADLAGPEWASRARAALVSLAGGDESEGDTLGVRLLGDVRTVFELLHRTDGEITTAALLAELHTREESPWKKLHKGEPLDPNGLARLLKPFGVRPRVIRQGEGTVRGYLVPAFFDAFERYLPSVTGGETPETAKQSNTGAGENVSGGAKHDPKHGAAVLSLFGTPGSVSPSVSPQGETDSINEDGPRYTVSGVSGRVTVSARKRSAGL